MHRGAPGLNDEVAYKLGFQLLHMEGETPFMGELGQRGQLTLVGSTEQM